MGPGVLALMFIRSLVLVVCFTGGGFVVARAERPEQAPIRNSFASFPMQLGEWRGVQEPPLDQNVLAVLGVDDYMTRAYFSPDHAGVALYVGYWGSQRQGDTMHSPLNCLPGAGWEQISRTTLPLVVADPELGGANRAIVINRYEVQKGADRVLVLYWYQSHGRVVASEYWGKFFLVRDAMTMNRTDGSLVRVIAPIVDDTPDATAELIGVRFIHALFPALNAYLPS